MPEISPDTAELDVQTPEAFNHESGLRVLAALAQQAQALKNYPVRTADGPALQAISDWLYGGPDQKSDEPKDAPTAEQESAVTE